MNAKEYKSPSLAVDAIVVRPKQKASEILLIKRKNPPHGWALPGGFVDYGESTEAAVLRELKEETNLDGWMVRLVHVASEPDRDPRQHVVSVVYAVSVKDVSVAKAKDDATEFGWFRLDNLPELAFDHLEIIRKIM